jgi:hypothetical protein
MSKRKRNKRPFRQQVGQARDGKRPLRDLDIAPEVVDMLKESLHMDSEPRLEHIPDLYLGMMRTVLRRMVELELARWMETVLIILKDEYGFTQEQLAGFARQFRERSTLQEVRDE